MHYQDRPTHRTTWAAAITTALLVAAAAARAGAARRSPGPAPWRRAEHRHQIRRRRLRPHPQVYRARPGLVPVEGPAEERPALARRLEDRATVHAVPHLRGGHSRRRQACLG